MTARSSRSCRARSSRCPCAARRIPIGSTPNARISSPVGTIAMAYMRAKEERIGDLVQHQPELVPAAIGRLQHVRLDQRGEDQHEPDAAKHAGEASRSRRAARPGRSRTAAGSRRPRGRSACCSRPRPRTRARYSSCSPDAIALKARVHARSSRAPPLCKFSRRIPCFRQELAATRLFYLETK